jgi:hypothetical protein
MTRDKKFPKIQKNVRTTSQFTGVAKPGLPAQTISPATSKDAIVAAGRCAG